MFDVYARVEADIYMHPTTLQPKRIECRKQPLKIKDMKQGRWLAIHCGKSKANFNDNTYELTKK
jgi:hypothetical protein